MDDSCIYLNLKILIVHQKFEERRIVMVFLLAGLAVLGGIFYASLPAVVKTELIAKLSELLSNEAFKASETVSRTGTSLIKFLIGGTVAGTVAVVGYTVLDSVADQRLQLSAREVQTLQQYWEELDSAGKETNTDPYILAAVWRVERSLSPNGPANGQGIGGFYSLSKAGTVFPIGPLTEDEVRRQLVIMGDFLHGKCTGIDISYDSRNDNSEDNMWARAECFARYNGSQGSLVRGVYSSNGQVFNKLPGHPETNGLTICLTDGCGEVGPMQHDGYETGYRKIKAHVVSNPQIAGPVDGSNVAQVVQRVTDKASGELQRLGMALDVQQVAWQAENVVEEAQAFVSNPPPAGKLAWPGPSNTWIQFGFGNPPGYTYFASHNGVDIDAPGFRPFMATSASTGNVIYAGYMDGCNRGVVKVQWTNSEVVSYVHLDESALKVGVGNEVQVGQEIGMLWDGPTTCSDGSHLHFMVQKNGVAVDPSGYLEK